MLRVQVHPSQVHLEVAGSDALLRLERGDALDVAMYGTALLGTVLRSARAAGATRLDLMVEGAGDVHDAMAATHGLTRTREIVQMRGDLPIPGSWSIPVRPFRVGMDESAFLTVNNRAFAWHPDQAGWTLADIEAREAEPWFDPDGFLLHERDGRLVGFCWTKVHRDERPPLGEIYVIGVDPDHQGHGLGRELVLAGFDWLSRHGLHHGILYVEATNAGAIALYEKLGLARNAVDRWWTIDLTEPAP